jgi:hypothetical protein
MSLKSFITGLFCSLFISTVVFHAHANYCHENLSNEVVNDALADCQSEKSPNSHEENKSHDCCSYHVNCQGLLLLAESLVPFVAVDFYQSKYNFVSLSLNNFLFWLLRPPIIATLESSTSTAIS